MSIVESTSLKGDEVETLEAGLDSLTTGGLKKTSSDSRIRKTISATMPSFFAISILLLLWAGAAYFKIKPPALLPNPLNVWHSATALAHEGILWTAVGNSLRRAIVGFIASVFAGTVLGLLLARFRLLQMALGPLVSGLQSLPSVAWVPAAIIWFGVSNTAIYAVVLFGAVPSIAVGLLSGVRQVPPLYFRVGRVIGAHGFNAMRFITLPAALPGYFAGVKQGWAFSWRALMAAELIASSPGLGNSLGQLLQSGRRLSDMSLVLAAIILILIVGVGIELIVFGPIERAILRTRGLLVEA